MADRLYNYIYKKILDEPWEELTIIVAQQLLILCPNTEGIFDLPLGAVRRLLRPVGVMFGAKRDEVDLAIDQSVQELVDHGMIKLYRENTVIWIKRKWSKDRYSNNENNQIGALRVIRKTYPEVLSDFCLMYELSKDLGVTKFELSTHTRGHTEPEPDSDPESKKSSSLFETPADTPPKDASPEELQSLRLLLDMKGWQPKKPTYADLLEYIREKKLKFPGVKIHDEAEKIKLWFIANPKRKPCKLMIHNWIERAFDRLTPEQQSQNQPKQMLGIKLEQNAGGGNVDK